MECVYHATHENMNDLDMERMLVTLWLQRRGYLHDVLVSIIHRLEMWPAFLLMTVEMLHVSAASIVIDRGLKGFSDTEVISLVTGAMMHLTSMDRIAVLEKKEYDAARYVFSLLMKKALTVANRTSIAAACFTSWKQTPGTNTHFRAHVANDYLFRPGFPVSYAVIRPRCIKDYRYVCYQYPPGKNKDENCSDQRVQMFIRYVQWTRKGHARLNPIRQRPIELMERIAARPDHYLYEIPLELLEGVYEAI